MKKDDAAQIRRLTELEGGWEAEVNAEGKGRKEEEKRQRMRERERANENLTRNIKRKSRKWRQEGFILIRFNNNNNDKY